jgi:hypothetical protein
MQENVVGTAHLIHNSVSDLNRAIYAAHTTLNNSINAFNSLNFNKFLENVIEEATPGMQTPDEETESTSMFGDLRGEDEKLSQALEMAFNEISKEKNADEGDEEEKKKQTQDKALRKQGQLGTSGMIKLPYVIGTKEFDDHPYAGLVYVGIKGLEQDDLHKDEM